MASFTNPGYVYAGNTFSVNGGASPVVATDTLRINGKNLTVLEWIRRGRIRVSSVAGNVTTYLVDGSTEKESSQAGG